VQQLLCTNNIHAHPRVHHIQTLRRYRGVFRNRVNRSSYIQCFHGIIYPLPHSMRLRNATLCFVFFLGPSIFLELFCCLLSRRLANWTCHGTSITLRLKLPMSHACARRTQVSCTVQPPSLIISASYSAIVVYPIYFSRMTMSNLSPIIWV
jgi:hypothetical protein